MLAQYARNPVVKNYLYRMVERQKPFDPSIWYYVDIDAMPDYMHALYLPCAFDGETEEFLEKCYEKSDWVFTQIMHSMLRVFFGWFMSMTTANGLLKRGSMFVFSERQFLELIGVDSTWKSGSFIDLGAGDGKVTENITKYFNEIYATEQSPTMQWRLEEKGFQILEIDKWQMNKYSLISALNLMDRIDHPLDLLKQLRFSVKDDGLVLIAIVLPYNPCYETGTTFRDPIQTLPIEGKSLEKQITSLHDNVFLPAGFEVVRFTRLPYLCEGDLHHDFFRLTDIVFVLRPSQNGQARLEPSHRADLNR